MSKESNSYKNSPKKVYIRTFGCQMNEGDSEFIAGLFLKEGYKFADSPENADIILFNTCSVREHAEERAIQSMGNLMHKHKNRLYGIVGCGAQALKGDLFRRLPALNIVCGTGEIARLPELIKEASKSRVEALDNIDKPFPEIKTTYRKSDKYAYVSIMRGCNNFCSYCIVPYVRGKERSRKAENIIGEIKDLAEKGVRDITLLGQNVNSYRAGNRSKLDFAELLKKINDIDGLEKIRFLTSHPKDVTIKLFETMRSCDKVAPHLHLPLQSGSDKILKLMRRGYTRRKYLNLVRKARGLIPDLRVTTDVIVGFPSENKKDFNDTLSLMKKIKFNSAYIFKYSPRAKTAAAKMKDSVSEEDKKRRHKVLLDLQKEISRKSCEKYRK